MGLLFFRSKTDVNFAGDPNELDIFDFNWLTKNGRYYQYFGDYWILGLAILLLIFATGGLAIFVKDNYRLPTIMLLSAGVLLVLLRLIVLHERNSFFYKKDKIGTIAIEITYFEIPIGIIITFIFGFIDFYKTKSIDLSMTEGARYPKSDNS
jgi:hypothetical protein